VATGLWAVAALRVDGVTAPYVIEGAMDGPSFLAYVEQVLVPTSSFRSTPIRRGATDQATGRRVQHLIGDQEARSRAWTSNHFLEVATVDFETFPE
jgi:hypothetical protein